MYAQHATRPGRTLLTVCIATAMLMLDIAVINSALPRVALDLHARIDGVEWIIDAYTLALAATVLTAGSIADRFGRRRLFIAGLVLFTISSAVCAAATTIVELDIARAVQGVGAAAMFSTSLALLGTAYPEWTKRAQALAIYGATIGASFAVGPLLGGAMTSWFGWRSVFLLNLPIGVLCFLGALAVRESRDPHPRRPDWIGQLLSGGALFLVILALLRGNVTGWTATSTLAEFAGALVLGVAFVVSQMRIAEPMLPPRMFADRSFSGIQIAAFAISSSLFAIFVYLTFYLQNVLHLTPIEAGASWMPATTVNFLVAGATASVLKRIDQKTVLIVGLAFVAVGLGLGLMADEHSSWWMLLPAQVVSMIGCGLFNPVMSGLVLRESPAGQEALAAGINDASRQTGIALGVALLGALVPTGMVVDGHAYVVGMHHALWLAAGIAAAGVIAGWVLIRRTAPDAGATATVVSKAPSVETLQPELV
ncbi:MAG TPA: MFS transporter [Jatrophihabitantaceae bacterium]|jgi:EmrB/QacA subfamily drug resistance transporter